MKQKETLPNVELKESDIMVFDCRGHLYFIRAKSEREAIEKCIAAQIKDGISEPVTSIPHKILVWE